jgi:predicted ABC-type ATPase
LPWFLEQADRAWLYDNSGAEPKLIGEKEAGTIRPDGGALPAIVDAVGRMRRA